jgi:hypothetical protein
MRPRARQTLAAALAIVAVVAVVAVIAVLPRSGHTGASVAVRGTTAGARPAIDLSGATSATSATSAPSAPSATTAAAGSTEATQGAAATPAQASPPAVTGPPISRTRPPGPSNPAGGVPAETTTTAVARAGPATGRLAVTQVLPNGTRGIVTMAADGRDERVLVTGAYIDPHWTPDGHFIVFESEDTYATWAVPAAGGPVTRLGDGAVAVVSPDGTAVINVMAVAYATGLPQLTVQKIAETAAGLVAVGPATPLGVAGVGPLWSPDGRRILYLTEMAGSSGLAIVNADGTGRHDLLTAAAVKVQGIDHPGFAADGSTISFLGTDANVYFVGTDGRGLRHALPAAIPGVSSQGAFSTNWSADRRRLAVLVNGGNSVVVVDPSGHVLATVHLTVGAFPVGIALDGSGQYVYYMGFPTSPAQSLLYSAALSGGASQRVGVDDSAGFPLTVFPG